MPTQHSSQNLVLIKEIRDGIVILKNNSLRSVLMVSSLNFELLSEQERDAITHNYQNFLNTLDFPLQILIHSRKLNITPYVESLQEIEKKQPSELLRIQTTEYREFVQGLVELENIMNKTFYVIVPFDILEIKQQGILQSIKNVFSPKNTMTGKQESFERNKTQLMQRVSHIQIGLQGIGLRAIPLDTEELIELFYQLYNPEASTIGNIAKAITE